MKIAAVLAAITPFLATDKKPEEVRAAILAADKKAKDADPEKVAKDKAAKDRKAGWDKARDAMPDEDKKKAFDAMSDEEKDKAAEDAETDPEHTNDEDVDAEDEDDLPPTESGTPSKGGANKKPAMDSAAIEKIVAAAVAKRDQLHAATIEVEPIVGKQAFDSAGAAYKAALDALHVDLTGVPESAYRSMLTLAKRSATSGAPSTAMDSANDAEVKKLIPHIDRL